MLNDLAPLPAGTEHKRTRRVLVIALGVSVALHAALLAFVPGFVEERQTPVKLSALEVVLRVPIEALPLDARDPDAQPAQTARAMQPAQPKPQQPAAAAAAAQAGSQPGPGVTSPGSSGYRPDPDRPLVAASARASEPSPAAPGDEPNLDAAATPAVVSAAYLDSPAPNYPDAARRLGQEGTVTLRVLVTVDGSPSRVALERSSGSPHLDGAALERVRNWRFRPARQGSAPVESWVIVPIVFRLEGAS